MVVFCTDYGLTDPFVGLCHAVIRSQAPGVEIVDLTHGVPAQDIAAGARVLADSAPWLPPAVLLGVVDPGVGTDRDGVIVRARDGRLLVGPDNGLLIEAAEACGGAARAWVLPPRDDDDQPRTFDGRDVFAPAAARLAAGDDPGDLGRVSEPDALARIRTVPEASVEPGRVATRVRSIDGFGNVQLTVRRRVIAQAELPEDHWLRVSVGTVSAGARLVGAFAYLPRKGLGIMPDAFGRLQLAVKDGDAAHRMGLKVGDEVVIEYGH